MNLLFHEVMPNAIGIVARHLAPWPDWKATIIRDTSGRVRVLLHQSTRSVQGPDRSLLQVDLQTVLGDWAASDAVLWCPTIPTNQKTKPAVEELIKLITQGAHPTLSIPEISVCERRISKEAWLGERAHAPPWPVSEITGDLAPAIFTFFSHKGGTGRTTLLVATAMILAARGKEVLLVDLDLEAPGLDSVFAGKTFDAGVLDYLVHPRPGEDLLDRMVITEDDPRFFDGNADVTLKILPAGKVSPEYMEQLSRFTLSDPMGQVDPTDRLRQLFDHIRGKWPNLDYILVDARAGFHDIGGLMLASMSHGAVALTTTNPQGLLGLRHVVRLLKGAGGAASVPLCCVHALAPEDNQSGSEVRLSLAEDVRRIFQEESYRPTPLQDPMAVSAQVEVLPVTFERELLGRGGPLQESEGWLKKNLLTSEVERIARRIQATLERGRL
jgi:MinD-like ATPase involved in chromosome partitioning or flagellar assembly